MSFQYKLSGNYKKKKKKKKFFFIEKKIKKEMKFIYNRRNCCDDPTRCIFFFFLPKTPTLLGPISIDIHTYTHQYNHNLKTFFFLSMSV